MRAGSIPLATRRLAIRKARGVALPWRNEPVSVRIPVYSASARPPAGRTPSETASPWTISAVEQASGTTRLRSPYPGFEAWWSMFTTGTGGRGSSSPLARRASPQSRAMTAP